MSNYDDLFNDNNKEEVEKPEANKYSKEDWAAKKKQERADAFSMLDDATAEMKSDPEKFRDYLNVQSRFDRYSVSNSILIAHQKPDATRIADFDTWKNNDVSILKGEKAFTMLEPGQEFTREDGTTGFSVNVKKVFDISQTSEADNAPQKKVPEQRKAIKALISVSPCDIRMTDELPDGIDAMYSAKDDAIYIRQGMDGDDIFASLAQEVAKAKLGNDTPRPEFTAYCVSYILCERNGFDTGRYDFEGVPKFFEDAEAKDFRRGLDRVRETANDLSQDMDRSIEAQEKKRSDGAR